MATIAAPVDITICFGELEPDAEPLGLSFMTSAANRSSAFKRPNGQGHGASPSLRRRAGRPPGGREWAGSFRGTHHGALEAQLGSPGVFGRLREMRDGGMITNEQCVSLATAAVGIRLGSGRAGGNVHEWTRGEAAEAGDLVAGTPIATFLDRGGRTTDRYAGGGSGTPGAHLDHAAVFQKYLTDKGGNRVGMEVSEQYKGSGGVHERAYYFNDGWGEGNASNYHVIDTPSGHLGGAANPLTQREQYHAAAIDAATKRGPQ
jgi:hypothetical protein